MQENTLYNKTNNHKNKILEEQSKLISNYEDIGKKNNTELLKMFNTNSENGLKSDIAKKKLKENGLNIVVKKDKKSLVYFLINSFKDKFIIILLILAVINFFAGGKDYLSAIIIIGIAVVSALIRFFQDYSVYKFNEELKSKLKSKVFVIRDGKEKEIKVEEVVVGDIIHLNAGVLIPADMIVIKSKDLFVNQSMFTGEYVPVEKTSNYSNETGEITNFSNILLMGSSIISGDGVGIVINTGFNTYLGLMNKELSNKKEINNFEKGIDAITKMLIKFMIITSICVFILNLLIHHNIWEALLFAISVAVGITPSMLPMIINVNLTKGTKTLAKKKTLVKNINSIQNLGAIDILCTDKTGTLTMDKITLQKYINVEDEEDLSILEYAYINSFFETGMKNLVDRAILSYGKEHNVDKNIDGYIKVDEIPFDYERKKSSVVVNIDTDYKIISKGALEEILKSCTKVKYNGKDKTLTKEMIEKINKNAKNLAETGMQVISLALKETYPGKNIFKPKDEKDMTFIGFVAFLDPPKSDAANIIQKLKKVGISTRILTGDNPYSTKAICTSANIDNSKILLGTDIDKMSDDELQKEIEEVYVFSRMNPLQKERVVKAYKNNGHVVGYMGDGVNDSPSLHTADIGLCVNTGADIAKESADIILLEKGLNIIYDGVIEGRKVYGNIVKYMKMALSADFGDVFSILIASLFLPFLPLIPIQMLIQDFIYDISQIGIPYDNVDEEFLRKPKKWDTKNLSSFMIIMGITSSIIDVLAFIIFWFVLGYNSIDKQAYFQTAWFIECLITELVIIHFIRTSKKPFIESKPNKVLLSLTISSILLTIITPIILHKVTSFNFVILPLSYYLIVIILFIIYTVIVQNVKKIYIKRVGEWL